MESSLETESTETVDIETTDGQELVFQEPIVPNASLELVKKNREKIDKQLSLNSCRVVFDIFAIMRFIELDNSLELDMTSEGKNPFIKHNLKSKDAKKIIELLLAFNKDSLINNEILHAFILFIDSIEQKRYLKKINFRKPEIDLEFLNKLDDSLKTTLDKYNFLNFDKHFNLPIELLAHISIEELIKFKKINTKIIKNKTDNNLVLKLNKCSLKTVDGWQGLSNQNILDPKLVCFIDLSNNNLKQLPANMLKGFTNLKKLNLANNELESLEPQFLIDCVNIIIIDLSNNKLKMLPEDFLSYCKSKPELITVNNPLLVDTTKTPKIIFISGNNSRTSNTQNSCEPVFQPRDDNDWYWSWIYGATTIAITVVCVITYKIVSKK